MPLISSVRGNFGPQARRRSPISGASLPGLSSSNPALSGADLMTKWANNPNKDVFGQTSTVPPSGYYWIKSASMPNALQMYVDTTEEGGGYDFYAINGTGTSINFANATHSGTALGLDIVYPRSKFHWRAMSNFVRNVLGQTGANYQRWFQIVYGVHSVNGGGDYTGTIMRNATSYGTGSTAHRVNDNGRWWIRDTTFGEPNGDYTAYAWFGLVSGGYTFPEPYALQDIGFNDGNANYGTGAYYLVSTNAKA